MYNMLSGADGQSAVLYIMEGRWQEVAEEGVFWPRGMWAFNHGARAWRCRAVLNGRRNLTTSVEFDHMDTTMWLAPMPSCLPTFLGEPFWLQCATRSKSPLDGQMQIYALNAGQP